MEQENSLMSLTVTGELLNVFTLCYTMKTGRRIGQCWFRSPSFQFPITHTEGGQLKKERATEGTRQLPQVPGFTHA